jgi:hypothetical protein
MRVREIKLSLSIICVRKNVFFTVALVGEIRNAREIVIETR